MEAAAGRRVDRARDVALEDDPPALPLGDRVRDRDRRQQRPGVRVARRAVELLRRPELDDLAQVHDRHPVADVLHDRQVVGDEQVGQPESGAQVGQEVEDLGLDRHVERRDRLVADDELRLDGERPGDADALALAAGELVRIALDVVRVEPDQSEQVGDRARSSSSPLARLWVSIGSAMIDPTVIRGSSDPYGSWKMICIRRRYLRSSPGSSVLRSTPSKRTDPPVASRSRIIARPIVLLPQPDSPTRPSVSPRRTAKVVPSTALTVPLHRLEDARPDREVDPQVVDLDEVGRIVRDALGGARRGGRSDGGGHPIHPPGSVAQQRAACAGSSRWVSSGSLFQQTSRA